MQFENQKEIETSLCNKIYWLEKSASLSRESKAEIEKLLFYYRMHGTLKIQSRCKRNVGISQLLEPYR